MAKKCKLCGKELINYKSSYCTGCQNKTIEKFIKEAENYIDLNKSRVKESVNIDIDFSGTLEKYKQKAKQYTVDNEKFYQLIDRIQDILYCIPGVGPYMPDIKYLIMMVHSYINKEYTAIPVQSIFAIIAGLLYVVNTIDLLPDFIPGVGLIDDLAVLIFVIKNVSCDINQYKHWFKENKEAVASE